MLEADAFYDTVKNLRNNVTLMYDTAVPTPSNEPSPSSHTGNQDSDSSNSEDDPEPTDHDSLGKLRQCGAYGCL